jgi:DNA-binding CsgD family transcriptional regulator
MDQDSDDEVAFVSAPSQRKRIRALLEAAGYRIVGETDASRDGWGEEPLTPREQEVLELVAEGLSNRQVAMRLGISEHTVKFHVASIYGKLGASTRAAAIRRGVRRGLITL